MSCENSTDGNVCGFPLADIDIVAAGNAASSPRDPPSIPPVTCPNGHSVAPGDQFCLLCGADISSPGNEEEGSAPAPATETVIDGWRVLSRAAASSVDEEIAEHFLAERSDGHRAWLILYQTGNEPDPAVHDVLRRMPLDHIPQLLATGRFEGRAYEVVEPVAGGSLADAGYIGFQDRAALRRLVDELARALASFAEVGLRHRDLRPETILLRAREPLDLVITSFGSARLSDFDLESVAPLDLTRYSAPEAIVGAVSAASDWWSLGMIALEQATGGACFSGVNDKAFHLHVVTRGIDLPARLDDEVRVLLRGLLARDPLQRWSSPQVARWLAGEPVEAPPDIKRDDQDSGKSIVLGGRSFTSVDRFALAAAEAGNWNEARDLVLRGSVGTWLEERGDDRRAAAEVRRLSSDESLTEDLRLALSLMVLNRALPLTFAGEIVTPAWLLAHPEDGYKLVTGAATKHLERMEREAWLVGLRTRAEAVRERAKLLEVELDEGRLRVTLLATSRVNLEAERSALRRIYPDTDHAGLSAIIERPRISDEDLIVLVSAAQHQFTPIATLLDAAKKLAERVGIPVDGATIGEQMIRPRGELLTEVEARIANFARCGVTNVDDWADIFRLERHLSLPRVIVLLAVPAEQWKEPPRQQYVATLLEHFEKRVSGAIGRGALVRFVIGKTTPRVDLLELGTATRPAEAILNHLLSRSDAAVAVDPTAYLDDPSRENRLRRLVSHASAFRRDSGIDGRYLGFPFVMMRDGRLVSRSTKPRIAPVLLWPVAIDIESGTGRKAALSYDRERSEVRLNPALEGLLGSQEFARWQAAMGDLLGRGTFRLGEVVDAFGSLATPRGRSLVRVPARDSKISPGSVELICAAALFNAEFTGQAVAEDLRQLRRRSLSGTSLDVALRSAPEPVEAQPLPTIPEAERYLTVDSDPSQDLAVIRAHQAPGLLVEGPPGTGKSQTIVNIVADIIGRQETVLVVCQKQAALNVVQKRLEAESLGDRAFVIVDVNRDREAVVRTIRDQVAQVQARTTNRSTYVQRERQNKAARIEVLEAELDRQHRALHEVDAKCGLSYRGLLGELLQVENEGPFVGMPDLRSVVGQLDRARLSRVEEQCAPLARQWLESEFEGSPLRVLRPFAADDVTVQQLKSDLASFVTAEASRYRVQQEVTAPFDVDDPQPYHDWLGKAGPVFQSMPDDVRSALRSWLDFFRPQPGGPSIGVGVIEALRQTAEGVRNLPELPNDTALFGALLDLTPDRLADLRRDAERAAAKPSFLGRLSFSRWASRRRARKFLALHGGDSSAKRIGLLRNAADLEQRMRVLRGAYGDAAKRLWPATAERADRASPDALATAIRRLERLTSSVREAADLTFASPRIQDAEAVARKGTMEAYDRLCRDHDAAFRRHAARAASRQALGRLAAWFEDDWIDRCRGRIVSGDQANDLLLPVVDALRTVKSFQRFRTRAATLDRDALEVFARLRAKDVELRAIPPIELEGAVRRTLEREALLSWKGRLDEERPELMLEREEVDRKIANLAMLDGEMRALNEQLLAVNIDQERVGSQAAWDNITRLTGPRRRSLRELFEQGVDLGLLRLRPVWLTTPDVASRMLPLKDGLFDLIIYDEASQMPVEHAVPTLFRARRMVIAGDEKQMPPSAFFSSRIDGDEDEDAIDSDAALDEAATETERAAYEEVWNRREIKDCPDLLQLGRGVLPITALQIHYRSKYRELIGFSNAAFYKGTLSVPARHPEAEVRRVKPIEVIHCDGIYEGQTNAVEAKRVVDVLAGIWSGPAENCPSVGVVTFNRKQADLVELEVASRCENPAFLRAYQREKDRKQAGEDMGFFVFNVENVQGHERDVIIFSTTFGYDANKSFRRNFGILGQTGGERRLNVGVTRAREKVVLVTSMPLANVSDWLSSTRRAPQRPRDFLQAYLDYAVKIADGDLKLVQNATARLIAGGLTNGHGDTGEIDGLVRSVEDFVRNLGHKPISGNDGDAFGIDFAIEDPRTGLFGIGIECDAPRHPLLHRARAREIWRPKVLQKAIPHVHRVASRAWYERPEEERARLRAAIATAIGREAA